MVTGITTKSKPSRVDIKPSSNHVTGKVFFEGENMSKILRKNLIQAAVTDHVGYNDNGKWWNILEKPWFIGDRLFEIWNEGKEYTLTISNNNIQTACLLKE